MVNPDSPAALKGKKIACPGPVFHESPEKIYAGVIIGTPGNRKNSVTVRFDEDGTRYWCVFMHERLTCMEAVVDALVSALRAVHCDTL